MNPMHKLFKHSAALFIGAMFTATLFSAGSLIAEDLSDNEVCLECHAGEEITGAVENPGTAVHTLAGEFHVEDHEMWACIDCHVDIEEIPHREDVNRSVDCLACHDEVIQ